MTVEDNGDVAVAGAFEDAKAAVHAAYTQWLTDREAEAMEKRAELERKRTAKQTDAGDLF